MFQYLSWLARDVALRDACSMYFTHGSMRLYLRDRAHPVGSRSEGVPDRRRAGDHDMRAAIGHLLRKTLRPSAIAIQMHGNAAECPEPRTKV